MAKHSWGAEFGGAAAVKADARGSAHDDYVRRALRWRQPPAHLVAPGWAELPRVDVAAYLRGDAGALPALAAGLRAALSGAGFFVMLGTGVDAAPVLDAGRRFHALPPAAKARYDLLRHPKRVGYAPRGGDYQVTSNRPTRNRMEYFRATLYGRRLGFDDNNWPSDDVCRGFRGAVQAHMEALHRLCHDLLPAVAASLDSPAAELALFGKRNESCTVLSYPPLPVEEGMYGIHPHVDPGFLTFVAQDAAGLIVSPWDGDGGDDAPWLRVPALPPSASGRRDAYIVNSGDTLKRLSNDVFKSTRHFVANPPPGAPARVSVPFFFDPSPDAPCACLSGTVSAARPARYPALSFREYFSGTGEAPPPQPRGPRL